MANVKREFWLQVEPTTTTQQHDDYWKLKAPDPGLTVIRLRALLEARCYATVKASDKEWLRDSLIRTDLGLMSYVPFSNDELRKLVHARRIDASTVFVNGLMGTRTELIELLDKADQHPQFHKFLDLPAEIRNRIYTMHIHSLDEPEVVPSQPPLTLVNRQIRGETLEMFYSSLRLPIELCRRHRSMLTSDGHNTGPRALPNHIRSFFQCACSESIALIRRFRFHVTDTQDRFSAPTRRFDAMTWFEIDLPSSHTDRDGKALVRFSQGPWERSVSSPVVIFEAQFLRDEMEGAIEYLNTNDWKNVLDLDMVLAIRKIVEDSG